jgi:predicted pyridoxine 5'-phosphate oxidase superfamily flavin-nucleotide-binding protein
MMMPKQESGDNSPFHEGERELQERFDSVRLADRIAGVTYHNRFTESDRAYLAQRDMFFLATSDAEGNLDCSYKGGDPGFVRVIDDETLAFPLYDGNGMFNSAGNIIQHGKVGMLFIDWERGWRTRINGTASIAYDDPLLAEYPEAQLIVRVKPDAIYPNCPRYIHRMEQVERSKYVPRAGCETPEAEWKDHFEDVLPADQQERRNERTKERR